ncbi:MAG TPA: hypothetical protein VGH19_21590 [Verrucomicrobiae bacterium]
METLIWCMIFGLVLLGMYISGSNTTSCKEHGQSRDCGSMVDGGGGV